MQKNGVLTKHIFISILAFIILYVLVHLSFILVQKILPNLEKYFGGKISSLEANLLLIDILLVISSVLVSYIVYLLMSSKTRAELIAAKITQSLYASMGQLKSIYEDAPIPYLTLDNEGNILDPNKAALRFFGVVSKEIEGKNIFYYQPKEDLEKADKFRQYYKSNIPINREEVRIITKDGKAKWVLLSVFKMGGPVKNGRFGLAAIFDISQQKELDKAKTEFVSLASHQLRTPSATIKWYADMLLSGDLGELSAKQQDYLERMRGVNNNVIDLVDTLLNVSRIEIGSIAVDIKKTSVPQIVEDILLELSAQVEAKHLNVNKQFDGNLENMESDPKLLRIVIQNLISNAIKYTPNAGTISIILKESSDDKAIIVSDTGIGIPESEKDKIFTKMFRAENVRKMRESQGSGLGLYLVKSMAEVLGGSINFVSEENKGSTFTINFKS